MRILHVTDCYLPRLGGIEMQVHDLALRQAGSHEVTVLTTTAAGDRSAGPKGCPETLHVVRIGGRRGGAEKIRYRYSARGLDMVTDGRFDLVHVHASSFSPQSFLAAHHASGAGIPTVATVHSLWAKATPLFRGADILTGWADWQVIWSAVSNPAATSLRTILRGRAPVTILPNGVDPAVWRVRHQPAQPGVLRLAVVSRLAPRKRLLQLMALLHSAHQRLPAGRSLHVEILGDGPQRERLERYLRKHAMDGWVHLRGRCTRSEIRSVFGRSDLFVAPASLESFGIAALEARCAGLPVLALAGTGVQDFVTHGEEGWLAGSDAALADTILSLATAPELLRRVAEHNRTVPASIAWPLVLHRCESLYRRATLLHGRSWATPDSPVTERVVSER